jgi:hypothetical protein
MQLPAGVPPPKKDAIDRVGFALFMVSLPKLLSNGELARKIECFTLETLFQI